ncbi:hypothetical protein DMH88_01175 [Escherichia coli]|nr:hypothetical protein [Escherichia coli]
MIDFGGDAPGAYLPAIRQLQAPVFWFHANLCRSGLPASCWLKNTVGILLVNTRGIYFDEIMINK